jgi:hypothetical protein
MCGAVPPKPVSSYGAHRDSVSLQNVKYRPNKRTIERPNLIHNCPVGASSNIVCLVSVHDTICPVLCDHGTLVCVADYLWMELTAVRSVTCSSKTVSLSFPYVKRNLSTSNICRIVIRLEFSRSFFENFSKIKFNENPSSGCRRFPCGWTDGQTWRS